MGNHYAVKFLDPKEVIAQLDIKPGSIVADFGCGPGYFSIPFAKAVGEEGKVYALDVLPQALEAVESQAKIEGIRNITALRSNLEVANGAGISDSLVDLVIMKDVLFQNKKRDIMVAEAYRVLKSGGELLVIDWSDSNVLIGPDVHLRISREDMKTLLGNQGFIVTKELQAGDFHYAFLSAK